MPLTNAQKQAAYRQRRADRLVRYEAALREIAAYVPTVTHGWADGVRAIAKTALED